MGCAFKKRRIDKALAGSAVCDVKPQPMRRWRVGATIPAGCHHLPTLRRQHFDQPETDSAGRADDEIFVPRWPRRNCLTVHG
ncbi:hypothetical protein GCM10007881_42700 [Mesorhizobium huakuii]|nr:hypothetical protein GCM10007881_42700 [Mesorhizobium huakuii]